MSDEYRRVEVITGTARRRRWLTDEKLRIVDETTRAPHPTFPPSAHGNGNPASAKRFTGSAIGSSGFSIGSNTSAASPRATKTTLPTTSPCSNSLLSWSR
jgi:hypothetical protein